jgi:hypothetical protein
MASPAFDIFQVEDSGVLWIGSEIAARAPGKYLFFDQKTGTKLVMSLTARWRLPAFRRHSGITQGQREARTASV